jgi:HlyD family secretion protein
MDTLIQKKFKYNKFIVGAVLCTALIVVLISVYSEYDLGNYSTVKKSRITTSLVIRESFEDIATVTGIAESINTVYLDAIQGGTVSKIHVKKGGFVEAGQELIEFQNTAFQLDVYAQEARVSEQLDINTNTRISIYSKRLSLETDKNTIEYEIKKLTRKLNIYNNLIRNGHVSSDEIDALEEELDFKVKQLSIIKEEQKAEDGFRQVKLPQLQESEERLKEHLSIIRSSHSDLIVKAPISGQITSLDIQLGESKSRGVHLGKIEQIDNFRIVAEVGSFYVSKVRKETKGSVDYQGKSYKVYVDRVYPEIVNGTFKVDLEFAETQPMDVKSGQNFIVKLELSESVQSLMVDNGAYYQDTGGQWVFVLDQKTNVATKRQVKLGRRNDKYVEINSGLEVGEKIITSSYANFLTSEKVILE